MKKNVISIVFIVLVGLLIQGCATGKFTQTGNTYPAYQGPVKVFTSKPDNIKYEEIGWVSSSGGMAHEWTHLIEAMQQKAASKGANAIIILAGERPNTGMAIYTPQYGLFASQGTQKSMTAIAIRILD